MNPRRNRRAPPRDIAASARTASGTPSDMGAAASCLGGAVQLVKVRDYFLDSRLLEMEIQQVVLGVDSADQLRRWHLSRIESQLDRVALAGVYPDAGNLERRRL